jgi:hypothetical protein
LDRQEQALEFCTADEESKKFDGGYDETRVRGSSVMGYDQMRWMKIDIIGCNVRNIDVEYYVYFFTSKINIFTKVQLNSLNTLKLTQCCQCSSNEKQTKKLSAQARRPREPADRAERANGDSEGGGGELPIHVNRRNGGEAKVEKRTGADPPEARLFVEPARRH